MKTVPGWACVSAGAAPVFLIGGWSIAQTFQPPSYDPVRDTISALAALGSPDRWIMSTALVGLGVCHIITATGLRPAQRTGRIVLAAGGVATVLIASFPQPNDGNSTAHTVAAAIVFSALGTWPIFAARRSSPVPLLTRSACATAAAVMLGLSAWFAFDLHGGQRGLAERAAAGAQALWPLAVVIASRRATKRRVPYQQTGVDRMGSSVATG